MASGAARGLRIDALDLRVSSFEHLRFSAIKAKVRAAIDAVEGPGHEDLVRAVLTDANHVRPVEVDDRHELTASIGRIVS